MLFFPSCKSDHPPHGQCPATPAGDLKRRRWASQLLRHPSAVAAAAVVVEVVAMVLSKARPPPQQVQEEYEIEWGHQQVEEPADLLGLGDCEAASDLPERGRSSCSPLRVECTR